MVNGIGMIGYSNSSWGAYGTSSVTNADLGVGVGGATGAEEIGKVGEENAKNGGECQTCKNRKYQDGSDEMVSFKSAAHVSPNAAGAAVRSHEGEHVSNAYKKAFESGGKVVSASVSIHTATCPECGRTYVSGGTTSTVISTPAGNQDKSNPYVQAKGAISDMNSRGHVINAGA